MQYITMTYAVSCCLGDVGRQWLLDVDDSSVRCHKEHGQSQRLSDFLCSRNVVSYDVLRETKHRHKTLEFDVSQVNLLLLSLILLLLIRSTYHSLNIEKLRHIFT